MFAARSFLLAIILSVSVSTAAGQDLAEAGAVAQIYMKAMLVRDNATVLKHMDPEVLAKLKQELVRAIKEAGDPSAMDEGAREFGYKDSNELLRAEPGDIYLHLVQIQEQNPEAVEAMKDAKVEVLAVEAMGTEQARVSTRVTTPTGKGDFSQSAVFLMRFTSDGWKVMSDNSPK
jgi:hypothetical protein